MIDKARGCIRNKLEDSIRVDAQHTCNLWVWGARAQLHACRKVSADLVPCAYELQRTEHPLLYSTCFVQHRLLYSTCFVQYRTKSWLLLHGPPCVEDRQVHQHVGLVIGAFIQEISSKTPVMEMEAWLRASCKVRCFLFIAIAIPLQEQQTIVSLQHPPWQLRGCRQNRYSKGFAEATGS